MVKVSIIMPVYNVEAYIRKSLDSVVNQTLKDIEAICVDDCSPDGSGRILDEYAAKDKRIRVFHLEKNGGPGVARNFALGKAKGEYIMFLDPDDWYELNACELAYNQIKKNKNDIVFFGIRFYDNKKRTLREDKFRLSGLLPYANNEHINPSEVEIPFITTTEIWHRIYSKDFLDRNSILFSTSYCGEDVIFAMRANLFARDVSVLNIPLYNYRDNNDNSMSHNSNKWKENFSNRYEILKYMEKNANANILNSYIVWCIRSVLVWGKRYIQANPAQGRNIYLSMRQIFMELNQKYNIRAFKEYLDYTQFKKIVKNSWWKHQLFMYLSKIFLLKDSADKKHKIFSFLGIKVKVRK